MSTWYQHNQEDYFVIWVKLCIVTFMQKWICLLWFCCCAFTKQRLTTDSPVSRKIHIVQVMTFIYLSIYMCHNDGVFTFYVSWYTVIVMFTLRICRGIELVWIMHIFIKSIINTCSKAIKGSFTNLSYLMTFKSLNYLLQKTNQRWKQSIKEAISWKY